MQIKISGEKLKPSGRKLKPSGGSGIAPVPLPFTANAFSGFLKEAEEEMKDIDKKDAPFVALALKLKIPVWSNDLHFKKQKKVMSYTTDEIFTIFLKQ
ncbi:MAG: hypothetical protein GY950_16405 [bacterium]|nr:hypothetical protein [bacterium]